MPLEIRRVACVGSCRLSHLVNNIDYNPIIEAIYEDVLSPEGFSGALRAFQSAFGIEQSWIVTWDRPNDLIRVDGAAGIIPEFQADYEEHYQFSDPAKENFTKINVGSWWVDSQQLGSARMRSSAFHQEFLSSYDMGSYMGSPILRTSEKEVALSFLRARTSGVFTDAETHSIDIIIPHLRNAFQIRERMTDLAATAHLSKQLLERLSFGIAVIDANLLVLLHNRRGEAWLSWLGPKWRWAHRHPDLRQTFKDLVRAACQPRNPPPAQASILRPSGRPSCHMVVLPLPASHRFAIEWQRPAALVLFDGPRRVSALLGEILRGVYGLSNSELRLAVRMADGTGLQNIAESLGISRETARSALKALFQKTGTHSQSQLIRLLTLLSAVDEPDFSGG
jgi:DNA-binding CsgD family transcriptional regulator/PAS domain-containing protein